MNKEPNRRKKSSERRGAASRGAPRGKRGSAPEHTESAAAAGVRLDLPIQGATIERRWDLYEPYLVVVGTYEPVGQPEGVIGQYMESQFRSGHFVADPGPSAGRDARGWSCPPGGPCTWVGIV